MVQERNFFRFFGVGFITLMLLLTGGNCAFAQKPTSVVEHFENGRISLKGKMVKGEKTGLWMYYHPDGYLMKKEKYNKGKFIWSVEYNERHRKVRGFNSRGEEIKYKGCNCKN